MDILEKPKRGRCVEWDALTLKATLGDVFHVKLCEAKIQTAITKGNDSGDWDYKKDLLWSLSDRDGNIVAAAVTQTTVCNATDRRKLHIYALAGDGFREWGLKTLPVIEGYARACGLSAVTLRGRRGWSRLLPFYIRNEGGLLERAL